MEERWDPQFSQRSPAYQLFSWLPPEWLAPKWPTIYELNQLLAGQNKPFNSTGLPIHFINQALLDKSSNANYYYEAHIHTTGGIPTRLSNWHDFFNALIWCTFPALKLRINALHCQAYAQRQIPNQRSAIENFLTLFDENGIIILSSEPYLLHLIKTMQWKTLFWHEREKVARHLICLVFGHSLHEKLLNPYIGMVGHSLLLSVQPHVLHFTHEEIGKEAEKQLLHADINFNSLTPADLVPIPVLGFNGWHLATAEESFYQNTDYFRSQRKRAKH